jgi:hypothetical protein
VALAFTMIGVGIVIAFAWLWYRPLVALAALAIGVAAGIALHRMAAGRAAARKGTGAATA